METPTVTALLGAWERGLSQSPVQRSLTLLSLVSAHMLPDQLARLSIGQRDTQLLSLREWAFGSQMCAQGTCPACTLELELTFSVPEIRMNPLVEATATYTLGVGEYEVCFRLPNSFDLARLKADGDVPANTRCLFECCVQSVRKDDQEMVIEQLPAELLSAISERMGEIDPLGDVQLSLTCPQCGHNWQAPLDIGSFLWSETHAWACRLLREVHILASVYGWRESDILALSPWRRLAYLEMVDQ